MKNVTGSPNGTEKGEVAGSEGDQALVESGLHDRVAQDDDGQDVADHTEQAQTWDQKPLDKCFGINLKRRLFSSHIIVM